MPQDPQGFYGPVNRSDRDDGDQQTQTDFPHPSRQVYLSFAMCIILFVDSFVRWTERDGQECAVDWPMAYLSDLVFKHSESLGAFSPVAQFRYVSDYLTGASAKSAKAAKAALADKDVAAKASDAAADAAAEGQAQLLQGVVAAMKGTTNQSAS
jgi:hypothetical protein